MRRVLLVLCLVAALLAVGAPGASAIADPLLATQWGIRQTRAEAAWATTTGEGIKIGIVDSGVDLGHPDLASKLLPGATFLSCGSQSCGDGGWQSGPLERVSAASPHGTHVAGIAAAATGNGEGVAGVAPSARIIPVKVIDEDGGTTADIARGIRFAVDNGARVVNLSLGVEGAVGQVFSTADIQTELSPAIRYAHSREAIVVVAAGNDALGLCSYPASEPGAVCVAASDRREAHSFYSNFPNQAADDFLPVTAPGGSAAPGCGEDVVSTVPVPIGAQCPGYAGRYAELAGTSMSAPHVAGVSALLAAQGRTRQNVLDAMRSTSRQTISGARGLYNPIYGFGIVDAAAAVATPVVALEGDVVTRVAGADRIATSVSASYDAFAENTAAAAVLARADAFADALAGAPLAITKRGPLLLSNRESLPEDVKAELQRALVPGAPVFLLGGTGALSPDVEAAVRALGFTTVRLAGADRYETAVRVAADGLGNPANLLVTTGNDFPDALSAGAAAGHIGGAVLLTAGSVMPAATRAYIDANRSARRHAVGGPAALADPAAMPLVGEDRFVTATAVAAAFFPTASVVGLASGTRFPDALSGGAHIGLNRGPLLLTAGDALPESVGSYLSSRRSAVSRGFVYGGEVSISEAVRSAAAVAIS